MNLGQPVARGNTADIYLCDDKIVKLFHDDLPDTESAYEAKKQQLIVSCGLPVPKIFDVTHINGKQAIVMEYIRGSTLAALCKRNMEKAESYLALSVTTQILVHQKVISSLESTKDRLKWKLQNADALDAVCKADLTARLEAMPSGNRLCHGDFHPGNLILTDSGIVIIDWVDATAGDPCADVCRTYLLYSQFSADLAESYLRLYCEKSGFTRSRILAWAPFTAGARLTENVASENAKRLLQIVRQYS